MPNKVDLIAALSDFNLENREDSRRRLEQAICEFYYQCQLEVFPLFKDQELAVNQIGNKSEQVGARRELEEAKQGHVQDELDKRLFALLRPNSIIQQKEKYKKIEELLDKNWPFPSPFETDPEVLENLNDPKNLEILRKAQIIHHTATRFFDILIEERKKQVKREVLLSELSKWDECLRRKQEGGQDGDPRLAERGKALSELTNALISEKDIDQQFIDFNNLYKLKKMVLEDAKGSQEQSSLRRLFDAVASLSSMKKCYFSTLWQNERKYPRKIDVILSDDLSTSQKQGFLQKLGMR